MRRMHAEYIMHDLGRFFLLLFFLFFFSFFFSFSNYKVFFIACACTCDMRFEEGKEKSRMNVLI